MKPFVDAVNSYSSSEPPQASKERVQRFDMECPDCDAYQVEKPEGRWVRYEDFAVVYQERERLQAANAELLKRNVVLSSSPEPPAPASKDLLACPHCHATRHGGVVRVSSIWEDHEDCCEVQLSHGDSWCVVCDAKLGGCGASSGYDHTEEKAIAKWNRRYSSHEPAVGDAWAIYFSDVDRPAEHFSGHGAEDAAHRRYDQVSQAWTCRLFRCVAETGYGPPLTKSGDAP